jgi:hypothetical protein
MAGNSEPGTAMLDSTNTLTLSLPLKVMLGKRNPKPWYLNMNHYRDAPFHKLSDAKIAFKALVQEQILQLPIFTKIQLEYRFYPRTIRRCDTNNVCAVIDKFFCDALKELDRIPDDDFTVLTGTSFLFGAVDKTNPRVDVTIYPDL